MSCTYYHDVLLTQIGDYLQYILKDIYGVTEDDCYIVDKGIETCRIKFQVNPIIPFINSLPRTINNGSSQPYYNIYKVNAVKEKIFFAICDISHPIGIYRSNPREIIIIPEDLKSIIQHLAKIKFITKFAQLEENKFVLYVKPYTLVIIVQIINYKLIVNVYNDVKSPFFDINHGYLDIFRNLNNNWNKWREDNDITQPIHEPNYV